MYPQILQQLVVLAAEALPILEKQLMDPRGPGDIRVSSWPGLTPGALRIPPLNLEVRRFRSPQRMPSPLFIEIEAAQGDGQWRGLEENRGPRSIQASCLQPVLLVLTQARTSWLCFCLHMSTQAHNGWSHQGGEIKVDM